MNYSDSIKLVRFGCGCVGFAPIQEGKALVLEYCNNEWYDNPLCINFAGVNETNTPGSPLSEEETKKYIDELNALLADGYRFRTIKGLLK